MESLHLVFSLRTDERAHQEKVLAFIFVHLFQGHVAEFLSNPLVTHFENQGSTTNTDSHSVKVKCWYSVVNGPLHVLSLASGILSVAIFNYSSG